MEDRTDARARQVRNAVPAYRLAARGREEAEAERLRLLEDLFDPGSRRRRALVQPGWRCLEVGAGRGSMAVWLADRVGPSGHVVATDIDLTYLDQIEHPNVEVLRHNILTDPLDELGVGKFDLVCSRLMLFWLADKQETALQRMAECVRPGGWLVDEDGDWGTAGPVDSGHPLYADYHKVWREGDWWVSRGYDPFFGRKLASLFERCGLQDIHHEVSSDVVRGASPWARWWQDSLEVITRLSEQEDGDLAETRNGELRLLTAPCSDPTAWFLRELLHACWGQRPPA